jgi:hypothetical protein
LAAFSVFFAQSPSAPRFWPTSASLRPGTAAPTPTPCSG